MLARLRKSMDEKEEGFTLIELLVVIIIIGILAAIAIPIFLNQRKKAVDASMKSDVKTVADALETWAVDNPSAQYPSTLASVGNPPLSQGNTVVIVPNTTTNGYCVKASNSNSSNSAGFIWYDSTAGGLQAGAPTATSPSAGVAGESC